MRFKIYNGSGYGLNGLTPSGGPIAAPLYLSPNPSGTHEAVTKEYVDRTLGHIPAENIVGTIPAERLPAFTGADIKSDGYGIFELQPTGVIPGTYNKITVNSKGFVVYGENIDYSVLTNVQWSDITADKPSTLEGYGITDAVKTTGATMTGALYLTAEASDSGDLVNKKYVDDAVSAKQGQATVAIGDIITRPVDVAPAGYLRTNGAVLDKTLYSALYAVIGDRYTNGSSVPTDKFQLPDTSLTDPVGLYSYIRAF